MRQVCAADSPARAQTYSILPSVRVILRAQVLEAVRE